MRGPRRYRVQKIQTPISIPNRRGIKRSFLLACNWVGEKEGEEGGEGNLASGKNDGLWVSMKKRKSGRKRHTACKGV